jgi:ribosomal protein L37AE/L43A
MLKKDLIAYLRVQDVHVNSRASKDKLIQELGENLLNKLKKADLIAIIEKRELHKSTSNLRKDELIEIILNFPRLVKCPRCDQDTQAPKSGHVQCSQCDWKFSVDAEAQITEGRPIQFRCPNCDEDLIARRSGDVICLECDWEFAIDDQGEVIEGMPPTLVTCPKCEETSELSKAGRISCPNCKWTFTADDKGAVTAGWPQVVNCPVCTKRWMAPYGIWDRCPLCETELKIDKDKVKYRCPHCKATGKTGILNLWTCKYCNGTGDLFFLR